MTLPILSATSVRAAAHQAGFPLVGLARAEALDPEPLRRWLRADHAAGMTWMHARTDERLDPRVILPGAATVMALGIGCRRPPNEKSRVAAYARGRDYHNVHRDRLRRLRKNLLALDGTLETYACVDTGPVMEKVWAERAGLGWIGKNGLLINPVLGSHLTLSVLILDRGVDRFDAPHPRLCGECAACLTACPTDAFPSPGVVDANRCLSYHSIENRGVVPLPLRKGFAGRVFGCDVCQDVCPYNRDPAIPAADAGLASRPLAALPAVDMASLSESAFDGLAKGTAVARAKYDGLRRNAVLCIGASRDRTGHAVISTLCQDASPVVAEAARWALERLRER